jgi:predicted Zn-dependent protease
MGMRFRVWLLLSVFAAVIGGSARGFAQNEAGQPKAPPDSSAAASDPKQLPTDQVQPGKDQQEAAPDDEPRQAKPPAIKHDGGKKDVNAVGNRKVGGFDMYSMESDIKIGKAYAAQLEGSLKMIQDPVVNEYVNRVGQNLVRNSDAKIPFTIKVVDDDSINAMALPGGFLYVNSGMILAADDEAELAGAMAHEIAHVALRHGTRTMTRANIAQILSIPVAIAFPMPVNVPGLVLPMTFLKFSREFEADADYFGVQYMYKAGYDPNALVTFFEKIQALEKQKPGAMSGVFATHPLTPDRIKKSQKEIAKILPAREHYIETTSEFSEVKGRLAVSRNRVRIADASENKPTLRRTPTDTSSDGRKDDEKKDADRPVLNRRDQ